MSVEVLKALARLDPEALDDAAKAARRAGVPLADFLSQAAVKKESEAVEVTVEDTDQKKPKPRRTRARSTKAAAAKSSQNDRADADLAPLTTALDSLSSRVDRAEARSQRALTGIIDALGVLAGRMPDPREYASVQQAAATAADRSEALRRLGQQVDEITQRLDQVESDPGADAAALHGLEEAIGRLSSHIEIRQDETAHSIQALEQVVERLAGQLTDLQTTETRSDDELRERMFEISETLDAVTAKTEGVVKRNQLDALEERFDKKFSKTVESGLDRALSEFTMRLEAAEGRSADAISAVERDLTATTQRLDAIDERMADLANLSETSTAALAASGALTALEGRLAAVETREGRDLDDLRQEFRELSNRLMDLERAVAESAARPDPEAPASAMPAFPDYGEGQYAIAQSVAPQPQVSQELTPHDPHGGDGMLDDTGLENASQDEDVVETEEVAPPPMPEPQAPALSGAGYRFDQQGLALPMAPVAHVEDRTPVDDPYERDRFDHDTYDEPEPVDTPEPAPAPDPAQSSFLDAARQAARAAAMARSATQRDTDNDGSRTSTADWRFAEDDDRPVERPSPFASGYDTARATRPRRRAAAPGSARALIMAAAVAVAGAVIVGAFIALQPAPTSRTATAQPQPRPLTLPPATGVPAREVSRGEAPSTLSQEDLTSASPAPGTSPFERSALEASPFEEGAPEASGLSELFDPASPTAVVPADPAPTPETPVGGTIPSVAEVLSGQQPAPAPTGEAEAYGPPLPPGAAPAGLTPVEARTRYARALGILRRDAGARADQEAAALLQQAADAGLAAAHLRLGRLYQEGRGVSVNPAAARGHYETAAAAGNRRAMHNLAVMYVSADGVTADPATAFQWFSRAAELGVTDSQFNLAVLYLRGDGVAENKAEAFRWFSIAAAQGDGEAVPLRDRLAGELGAAAEPITAAAIRWMPAPMDPEANGLFYDTEPTQEIVLVQNLLQDLGFDPGTPDGLLGPRTREAIRAFEQQNGLPVTGSWSPQLVQRMREALNGAG